MLKAYIATGLQRAADHNLVRDALLDLGIECSYDWTTHGAVFSHGLSRLREVAELEANGVEDADVVIVLLPGARGTHAELGMAIALNKPIVLHSMNPKADFGIVETTCAFYHHPLCTQLSEFNCGNDKWFNVVAGVAATLCPGFKSKNACSRCVGTGLNYDMYGRREACETCSGTGLSK